MAKDLPALTPPGTTPSLCPPAIPVSAAARTLARSDGRPALAHALSDGEDFELLFTVAARADRLALETAWRKKFRTRLTCIGRFTRTLEVGALPLGEFNGYEHLR